MTNIFVRGLERRREFIHRARKMVEANNNHRYHRFSFREVDAIFTLLDDWHEHIHHINKHMAYILWDDPNHMTLSHIGEVA